MTEDETVLSTTGQETVRFNGTLCYQVVNHHSDITVASFQNQLRLTLDFQSRIDTSDNPLASCFFVTWRSIGLTSCEKSWDFLGFQSRTQLMRQDHVVLDSITSSHHLCIFQTFDGMYQVTLHILRKAGWETLDIYFFCIASFWLKEELVAFLVRKTHNFILNRWTVTRPHSLDHTCKHRRTVEVVLDNLMTSTICVGQPAWNLVLDIIFVTWSVWEVIRRFVSWLDFCHIVVDRGSLDTWRRSCLETTDFEAEFLEIIS